MTTKERIMSVYNNVKPDKVPITIYDRYLPRGSIEREVRELGVGIIKYSPVVSMLAPPWHIGPGYLSEVANTDINVKYFWDKGVMVERRSFKTPVGSVYQEVSADPSGAGSEHIRKHYISEAEDYKVIQYIVEHTVVKARNGAGELLKKELGEDGVVFGRLDRSPYQKCLIELAGAERFFIDLVTDPEPVTELLHTLYSKMTGSIEKIVSVNPDVFWQPDNITVEMTPPDKYMKYCMPVYEVFGKAIKEAGKPYLVHIDGKMKPLKDLINQSSFDIIESLSYKTIGGDYALTEAYNDFPKKVIIPNYPTNACYMEDKKIFDYTVNLIEEASSHPFLISFSEDIPPSQWQRLIPIVCKAVGSIK